MAFSDARAVIFDMDGTLIDSEVNTRRAIDALLRQRQQPCDALDLGQFEGITWQRTAEMLVEIYPALVGAGLASALQQSFHEMLMREMPRPIEGARKAVLAASRGLPTAVASSSNRESVHHVLRELGLLAQLRLTVCAEDCTRSKPDPECYLLASERLGQPPERCLVFEDSIAGLQAARAAGAGAVVAITAASPEGPGQLVRDLADLCIDNYTELAPDFFDASEPETALK